MNKQEAIEILREFDDMLIADVYETYDDATDAILALRPTFEYPDWDYKTVAEFIKANF